MAARYLEIASQLRKRIENGEYPRGAQLPTRPELMTMFEAASNTVARAVRELQQDGYVEVVHGTGVYALAPPKDRPATLTSLASRMSKVERNMSTALRDIAELQRRMR